MTTATLTANAPVAAAPARAIEKTKKSIFKRFLEALVEARMHQAAREIALHRHLIPQDEVAKAGYKATLSSADALPFVR